MKVAVLAQDGASTWMLVNALRAEYPELIVCLEPPEGASTILKRRARRIGWLKVAGQVMFILAARVLCRRGRLRGAELMARAGLDASRPAGVAVQRFCSANSSECIAWLAGQRPDAVVVNGTRILSANLLASCDATFLNIHCGITPQYRGVHGGYWAMYQGDPANAGVTVHVVDRGVDTGGIVYQQTIEVDAHDDFASYPVKQYIAGVPLMRQALRDLQAGRLTTYARQDLPSAIWQHPTLWQYLGARWRRGIR